GGPAVSGILVALVGPGWVFVIDAITFVASALSLALLKIPPLGAPAQSHFWQELAEGWRAVTSRRWYLLNLCSHALWNVAIPGVVWLATAPPLITLEGLARANSFDWLHSLIAMPLGFAVMGPVSDRIGIPTTLVVAAVLLAVPSVLIMLVPGVRNVRRNSEGQVLQEPSPA